MTLPTDIILHQASRQLELRYDEKAYHLPAEYLRVYSPSAEVRGHGEGQEVLQLDKQTVGIDKLEPTGHYALKIHFDDGHDSGLYTWEYLYSLATEQTERWQDYLNHLKQAGHHVER
jgi:DUF971 family protein